LRKLALFSQVLYHGRMPSVTESERLARNVIRLRRAERVPAAAHDVSPVRRDLEARLGPTLSRSRAARILGVSQTALDRWVAVGRIPVVLTPTGRTEVPCQFVIEVREAIDGLERRGKAHRLLAAALEERRRDAERVVPDPLPQGAASPRLPQGHLTAERRALAYHREVAARLNEQIVDEARERIDRLAADRRLHPRYADRWRQLLSRPLPDIAQAISADDDEGRDLRQNGPFAGVLNEEERRRIIAAIR
jgi:hypothetical protein